MIVLAKYNINHNNDDLFLAWLEPFLLFILVFVGTKKLIN